MPSIVHEDIREVSRTGADDAHGGVVVGPADVGRVDEFGLVLGGNQFKLMGWVSAR